MKNLSLLSIALILSMSCFSQLGVHAGLNLSSYTGGSEPYTGVKNLVATPKAGVYAKIWLSKKVFLQPELDFLMMGAKNPVESPENFHTFHIHLPVVVGIRSGQFSFQAGAYVNKMLKARNHTWYGVNSFSWDVEGWEYLDHINYGGVAGIGYDAIGVEFQINYMHDFNKTQNIAWDYNVKKLGYNHALSMSAYIPFKIKYK